jgi:hypothetical protein
LTGDFSIEPAGPEDDSAIQRLLAESAVPGRVIFTFEQAPSYFLGCRTMGRYVDVAVARHRPTGQIVGVACRATRARFVNGSVQDVGYLTHLRVDPRYRGRWLLPAFGRFLRRLDEDGRTVGYVAIISEENRRAQGVLADRARGSVPTHRRVCRLNTLALILRFQKPEIASLLELSFGSASQLPEIVAFLRKHGAEKQFFPAYTEEDFQSGSLSTFGFRLEDFILARRAGELVGVVGLWDRSNSKQAVVRGYSGTLRWSRPLANIAARLVGASPLPRPGERLKLAYASFIAIADNNPEIFRVLLRRLYNVAARGRYACLVVDLAEGDPLLAVARRYLHLPQHRGLYTAGWGQTNSLHDRLDGRIPYVETAAL